MAVPVPVVGFVLVLVPVSVPVAMLGLEEGAIMGHMVGDEKLAAWVEEGGEDAGDGVYIGKMVVGLRALVGGWGPRSRLEGGVWREEKEDGRRLHQRIDLRVGQVGR